MALRNAASVFPDPVGAAIRVWRPSRMAAQPRSCADVGVPECFLEPLRDDRMKT